MMASRWSFGGRLKLGGKFGGRLKLGGKFGGRLKLGGKFGCRLKLGAVGMGLVLTPGALALCWNQTFSYSSC